MTTHGARGGAFTVEGKRVLVVGAALSGIAAAELLARRGARVTLTDAKPEIAAGERLRAAGVALALGRHDRDAFTAVDLVVTSPGVPWDLRELEAARAAGVEVIGEIELASRWLAGRVVAITGTKGKSTTTTLVGRMLAEAGRHVLVGGNIGVPLSEHVDASTPETLHVVEVSSFQLEATATFHPWIAAITNFSADHLDRHPTVEAYASAKARAFANQDAGDWAVVNADDPAAERIASASRARRLLYSSTQVLADGVCLKDGVIWQRSSEGDVPLVPYSRVRLHGAHMASNVVAAAAITRLAGAPADAQGRALDGFTGLEHVMEPVAAIGGVRFVNDSKATNVEAAARSIESFDGVVAIVGGKYKGGAFDDLAGPLAAHGRAVVAIGEARPLVVKALAGRVPIEEADTLEAAVARAHALAQPDGVVLLAPACSSFDMFESYAARGRAFKEIVARLAAAHEGR
jgi:UDP-N-acetylmuramoylalanine--D-glutamate ligase